MGMMEQAEKYPDMHCRILKTKEPVASDILETDHVVGYMINGCYWVIYFLYYAFYSNFSVLLQLLEKKLTECYVMPAVVTRLMFTLPPDCTNSLK